MSPTTSLPGWRLNSCRVRALVPACVGVVFGVLGKSLTSLEVMENLNVDWASGGAALENSKKGRRVWRDMSVSRWKWMSEVDKSVARG